jgi:hypothetical protein
MLITARRLAGLAIFAFLAYLVVLGAALSRRSTFWRYVGGGVGALIFFGLLACSIYAVCFGPRLRSQAINPNLRNTVLIALIAIGLFAGLYSGQWWQARKNLILELSEESVAQVPYPGVAVLQMTEWSAQANLQAGDSNCFVGVYSNSSSECSELGSINVDDAGSCNCSSMWTTAVIEKFEYMNSTYRYLDFRPSSIMTCTRPTTLLLLQTYFDYDLSAAEQTNLYQPSPGLSIALYDPRLNFTDALSAGYTRLVDINALGSTSINMNLRYRKTYEGLQAYDYQLELSSAPALNLVCNTANDKVEYRSPCTTSLLIHIPSFQQLLSDEKPSYSWTDVVVEAGAWFSFVQIFAWLASFLAFDEGPEEDAHAHAHAHARNDDDYQEHGADLPILGRP